MVGGGTAQIDEPASEAAPATAASAASGHRIRDRWATLEPMIRRWGLPVMLVGFAGMGLLMGLQGRLLVLFDDAGITMRYAHRIAAGDGWTYNDGDRTNGASAPLYTMVLAAMKVVGIPLITAAKGVGIVSYTACIVLSAYLATRISGLLAGALAGVFLLCMPEFLVQSSSGMESAFAAAIGLAVIAALLEDRDNWAGLLLGLAVVNKLDAGMLALAVALAYVLVLRRPPWRIAVISAAVAAPWFVFSTWYFGSPLPHSFTQKVASEVINPTWDHSPFWVIQMLRVQALTPMVVFAVAATGVVWVLARHRPRPAMALLTCVAWSAIHGVAFSLVDFGDAYGWYLTVLYPPIAVAAACTLGHLVRAAQGASRPALLVLAASLAVLGVGLADEGFGRPASTAQTLRSGHTPGEFELFERARRQAAQHVALVAEPGEVIRTCWGWVAFEAIDNPIDETCPLNTREDPGRPTWQVEATLGSNEPPVLAPRAMIEATFFSAGEGGGRADVIRLPVLRGRGD